MKMRICETEVRVRYQETDNMGVVYYGNYFTWFEIARTEYFRTLGIVYRKLEEKGVYLMVASASCQYKSPARYDDILRIESWVPEARNTSMKFAYNIFRDNTLLASGESVHVATNKSGRPVRLPQELKSLFTAHNR